ncbi:MAG: hypothetical protein ACOH13_13225 [Flavobacteriales bacterium]
MEDFSVTATDVFTGLKYVEFCDPAYSRMQGHMVAHLDGNDQVM